jgi:uncharacterized protein YukE
MRLRYTPAIDVTGDGVISVADRIQQIGDEMYSYVRGLVGGDELTGQIADALEASKQRWHTACDEFAMAERRFGTTTKEAYANMMAADARGANLFA